jgi:hypothetical protein
VPVRFRGAYHLHFYRRGLKVELVRELLDTARISEKNKRCVFRGACLAVSVEWVLLGGGRYLLKKNKKEQK